MGVGCDSKLAGKNEALAAAISSIGGDEGTGSPPSRGWGDATVNWSQHPEVQVSTCPAELSGLVRPTSSKTRSSAAIAASSRARTPTQRSSPRDGGEAVKRLITFARDGSEGPATTVDLGPLLDKVVALTAPRWREALINLILNAIDALPHGGSIELRAIGRGTRRSPR